MGNSIRFILNGLETEVSDPGRLTLLQYLRNVECLKGTKEACGTGHCGACSVLIDDRPAIGWKPLKIWHMTDSFPSFSALFWTQEPFNAVFVRRAW